MKFIRKLISAALIVLVLAISVLVFQLLRFQHGEIALDSQATFLISPGSNIKYPIKFYEINWCFILFCF